MKAHELSDLLAKLRDGKEELREQRRNLSLPDKVRQVVELQRVTVPAIRRRRELQEWEGVWPIEK